MTPNPWDIIGWCILGGAALVVAAMVLLAALLALRAAPRAAARLVIWLGWQVWRRTPPIPGQRWASTYNLNDWRDVSEVDEHSVTFTYSDSRRERTCTRAEWARWIDDRRAAVVGKPPRPGST